MVSAFRIVKGRAEDFSTEEKLTRLGWKLTLDGAGNAPVHFGRTVAGKWPNQSAGLVFDKLTLLGIIAIEARLARDIPAAHSTVEARGGELLAARREAQPRDLRRRCERLAEFAGLVRVGGFLGGLDHGEVSIV